MTPAVSVRWEPGVPVPGGASRRRVSAAVRRAVRVTLSAEAVAAAEISVALVGDATIEALNAQWLGHDGTTDVLSFPLYDENEPPVGDVYIGVAQAERQARAIGIGADEEIVRLAIHGTLHVLGHDHPEGEARLRTPMWKTQERLVREVMGA